MDYFEPVPQPSAGPLEPAELELLALIGALEE
jgi:hypothetical protein